MDNKRSQAGPMDFEYHNKSGPVEASSPWVQLPRAQQSQTQQATDNLSKKRTHEALESPTKAATFPFQRNGQFSFSGSAFTTPRKLQPDYASSEAEANSSPENADSEATPETYSRPDVSKKSVPFTHILDSGRQDGKTTSFFGRGVGGRGEIARSPFANGIEKRHYRQRTRERNQRSLLRVRHLYDSDSSEDNNRSSPHKSPSSSQQFQEPVKQGLVASVLGFIDTHPNLPHVLSFYAQLALNVFMVSFIIYLVYSFWATIRTDVDQKSLEEINTVKAKIAQCHFDYHANHCDRDTRVPALEALCNNWAECKDRDATLVGRAKVSAHTFAEIFNSFIEPISYKAMIFSLTLVFGCLGVSNFAFAKFRARDHHHHHAYPQQPPPPPRGQQQGQGSFYMPTSPMTSPQRQPSQLHDDYWNQTQLSPSHARVGMGMGMSEQQQQQQQQQALTMGEQSPSRRLQF